MSKKVIKKYCFFILFFLSGVYMVWVGFSSDFCLSGNKFSTSEIYNKAKYIFILKEIEKSNHMINKFTRCKYYKCGVFYLKGNDLLSHVDSFDDMYYVFLKLNDMKLSKDYISKENVSEIYVRDYNGMGVIYIFNGIFPWNDSYLLDKVIDLEEEGYYMNIIMKHIDSKGYVYNETPLNSFYQKIDSCGNPSYFF